MAKKAAVLNNDWQSIIAKPEVQRKNKFEDDKPDPFYQKRPDVYYTMFPSAEGEKYAFGIVPAADGQPFIMTDVMTIKRHRFTSPKTGIHYFENLKLPMDPAILFDMTVLDRAADPNSLTEEDKVLISNIKRHSELVQRYKELQYAKVMKKISSPDGVKEVNLVNFGYAKNATLFNSRLQKQAITGFFAIWTKWKGLPNTKREFSIKFINSRYNSVQDKFRALLTQTAETHNEDDPTWFEKYFSSIGGVAGVIDIEMGDMSIGGRGATIKLVKLGKDVIDDKGVGVTGPITEADIVFPSEPENKLSLVHYLMGFKSTEALWQDDYVDRFETAIEQLEKHVEDKKLELAMSAGSAPTSDSAVQNAATPSAPLSDDPADEDLPF